MKNIFCNYFFSFFILCIAILDMQAQSADDDSNSGANLAKTSNLNIPPIPALVLCDLTTNKVIQAGNNRSVKVDWKLGNYKAVPNLAIELQPLWLLYYNKPDLKRYRAASPLMRKLSTLSFSAASYNWNETTRSTPMALKITLYQEEDPLLDRRIDQNLEDFSYLRSYYKTEIKKLSNFINKNRDIDSLKEAHEQRKYYRDSLYILETQQEDNNRMYREDYLKNNWNASTIDLGMGKIWTYDLTRADSVTRIGNGFGMWLSGSQRLGYKLQLTGMVKFVRLSEDKALFLAGTNLRYGNPRFSFYTELVYDFWDNKEESWNVEKVLWGYGGDLKLSNIIQLTFGVRTNLDQNLKFANFFPAANITCLMNL